MDHSFVGADQRLLNFVFKGPNTKSKWQPLHMVRKTNIVRNINVCVNEFDSTVSQRV